MASQKSNRSVTSLAIVIAAASLLGSSTGCQVSVAGQTLPSAYYLYDDIQYFPAGPENKLANETAALKAAREQSKAAQQTR
jgi:hypothetical protein